MTSVSNLMAVVLCDIKQMKKSYIIFSYVIKRTLYVDDSFIVTKNPYISCFRVCIVKKILFSKMTRPARERKIAILGYRSVGKSCLAIQFIENKFVEYYEPTIEHTFKKSIVINNQSYDLSLVDTAGQDEYTIFPPEYSVEMNGYVLVYSIDSPQSFEICKNIHFKLVDLLGTSDIPTILVGNKCDLEQESNTRRKVSQEEGKQLAEKINAMFIETSAKDNENVEEIFRKLIVKMENDITDEHNNSGRQPCTLL